MNRRSAVAICLPILACSPQDQAPGFEAAEERSTIVEWSDSMVLEESLRIGALDGPRAFGELTDLALHPDGGIVVFDLLANQLRHFSANGSDLGLIGRRGQGPGEYEGVNGVAVSLSGTIVVHSMDGRMVVFDAPGDSVGGWPVNTNLMHDRKLNANHDGSLMMQVTLARSGQPFRIGERGFVRFSSDGSTVDTLGDFWTGLEEEAVANLPNQPRRHLEWSPHGFAVAGVSSRPSITLFRGDGQARTADFNFVPPQYDQVEFSQWLAHARWLRTRVRSPEFIPDPPATMPAFLKILPSRTGEIWVQVPTRSIAPAAHWTPERNGVPTVPEWDSPLQFFVFDSLGALAAVVRGPVGLDPRAVSGDTVWAYSRGRFGEQYISQLVLDRNRTP